MPKVLFWNINAKDLSKEIADLCAVYDPDILVLAESKIMDEKLLRLLNLGQSRIFEADLNVSRRIKFYSRYESARFEPVLDDNYFSVRHLRPYLGRDLLLVGVHLPSKIHAGPIDQLMEASHLAESIRTIEVNRATSATVVIGDFNMSPFEDAMVAASGMHAILDRTIALKTTRIVKSREYPFFYNPMWSCLGDLTKGPPGTHKYSKAVEINHFWHTFDQVLIRPSLIEFFKSDDVEVIELSGSDHYPIFFNLRTEIRV